MYALVSDFAFLRGLVAGAALAAPIGAVGVMCIRRTLSYGLDRALFVGLGSALADALFGAVAGLGLSAIASFVVAHEIAFALIGGAIVTGVGVITYRAPVRMVDTEPVAGDRRKDVARAFLLSIVNPATLLGAIGIFAVLGAIDPAARPLAAGSLVVGVFAGSMLWWLTLGTMARVFREKFMLHALPHMNQIEGAVIGLFGIVAVTLTVVRIISA